MKLSTVFSGACILGVLAWVSPVHAQERDDDARHLFEAAQVLYEDGAFHQAGQMFERAYRLSHRTSMLYNAYLAYRDGQMRTDAARTLRAYLAQPDAQFRDRLTPRLEALEQANTATLDGASEEPATPADPTPEAELVQGDGTAVPDARSTQGASDTSNSPVGPVLLATGSGMLLVGGVMGILASKDADELARRCPTFVCAVEDRGLRDQSRRRGNASTALLVGGGLSAVAGVVLWLVLSGSDDDERTSGARTRVDVGCDSQGCAGTVRGAF